MELKAILFKTGGPYLVLQNSNDRYALIDYSEFGEHFGFKEQAIARGASPKTALITQKSWAEDGTRRTPGVKFDPLVDGWELIQFDGETFAELDAGDVLALFQARGM